MVFLSNMFTIVQSDAKGDLIGKDVLDVSANTVLAVLFMAIARYKVVLEKMLYLLPCSCTVTCFLYL